MARIYRTPFTHDAQVFRWLRRSTAGSVLGLSESAAPVRLDRDAQVTIAQPVVAPGSGTSVGLSGSLLVAIFATSGTWTMPAGAQFIRMFAVGAGGGGRGGAVRGAGLATTGGFGGGNGLVQIIEYLASDVADPLTVTVGTGGAGGAAATTNVNNAGGVGGVSSVTDGTDNYVRANGAGSATSATALFPTHDGGSISAGNVASGGGAGVAGWSPGTGSPQQGNTGIYVGNPGLGGSASTTADGGVGGVGGFPGGGGGGGGAARTGHTSGAGAAGADGLVVIVTHI